MLLTLEIYIRNHGQNLISVSIVLRRFIRLGVTLHKIVTHGVNVYSLFMRLVSTEKPPLKSQSKPPMGSVAIHRVFCSCVPGTSACSRTPCYRSRSESPYACCVLMTCVPSGVLQRKHPCHRCCIRKGSDSHDCTGTADIKTASCK